MQNGASGGRRRHPQGIIFDNPARLLDFPIGLIYNNNYNGAPPKGAQNGAEEYK